MAVKEYVIKEFKGIDQSKSENTLDAGSTPDARNMDTENGDLAVGKGYVKHIADPVPGEGEIRRLYVWRDLITVRTVVIAGNEVYAWRTSDETPHWIKIYTCDTAQAEGVFVYTGLRWDFLETKIGNADYLLIANGERQVIKWDGEAEAAVLFGAADKQSDKCVNFMALHYDRMFSAGDQNAPSRLYWSKTPGGEATVEDWGPDDASAEKSGGHTEVGSTDTDPILGLCPLSNQLLIFKRDSVYRLLGDRPGNYRVVKVNAEVEEMADTSCIMYGDTPFWMTSAGMYYYDGQTAQPMYNARSIRNYLKGARLTLCKGQENRDRLYFTCRKDGAGALDNAMIVYDVPERTYMIRDGFSVADIFAAAGTLYMINDARYVYRFGEGDTYDGAQISAYWQTPLTDMQGKQHDKTLREMYFRGEAEPGSVVVCTVKVGKNSRVYRYMMPEDQEDVQEIPLKNVGRTFSFRFENEAGKHWTIQGGVTVALDVGQRPV